MLKIAKIQFSTKLRAKGAGCGLCGPGKNGFGLRARGLGLGPLPSLSLSKAQTVKHLSVSKVSTTQMM